VIHDGTLTVRSTTSNIITAMNTISFGMHQNNTRCHLQHAPLTAVFDDINMLQDRLRQTSRPANY